MEVVQRSAGVMTLEPAGAWLRGRAAEARAIGLAGSEPSFPGPMHVLRNSYCRRQDPRRGCQGAMHSTALLHLDPVSRYALYLTVHRASQPQRPLSRLCPIELQ